MKPQLAVIRGCVEATQYNGLLVEVVAHCGPFELYTTPSGSQYGGEPEKTTAVKSLGSPFLLIGGADEFARFLASRVFPINDNPGNESFVTQARKSLPRPKDVVLVRLWLEA